MTTTQDYSRNPCRALPASCLLLAAPVWLVVVVPNYVPFRTPTWVVLKSVSVLGGGLGVDWELIGS